MTDEERAEIAARNERIRRVSPGIRTVADTDALLAEIGELRNALLQIVNRYRSAEGTPLADYWGLPWAMADDARSALGLPVDAIHRNIQP